MKLNLGSCLAGDIADDRFLRNIAAPQISIFVESDNGVCPEKYPLYLMVPE
jgi:hypothetical protein